MEAFELSAKISIDTSEFEKSLQKAEQSVQNAGKNIASAEDSTSKFGDSADEAGKSVKSLGEGAKEAGSEAEKSESKWSSLSEKLKSVGGAIGSGLATAAKVGTAALAAAGTAIAALTKQAVDGYGEYEQLKGGIETLFGTGGKSIEEYAKAAGKSVKQVQTEYKNLEKAQTVVLENAANAYKTAGMSQNEYIETVTGFSASLISSLNGDTQKAAQYADMAIVDMSDNANKMGSDMEALQNAYSGFAKQNYTMLDNLKLGYGGTKEEMQRLLADAEKLSGQKFDISSYADVVQAIHVVQENMEITGTTAKEASSTIQGSLSSLKSAWGNLVAGLANGDMDLGLLIKNVVDAAGDALGNLMPTIEKALGGIADLIARLSPIIAEKIPALFTEILPKLLSSASDIINSLVSALPGLIEGLLPPLIAGLSSVIGALAEQLPALMDVLVAQLPVIVDAILTILPQLTETGIQLIIELMNGMTAALPAIIPQIVELTLDIVDTILDNIDAFIDAAIQLINALAEGLIQALPTLLERAPEIIQKLVDAIVENFPLILGAGAQVLGQLVSGLLSKLEDISVAASEIITSLINGFMSLYESVTETARNIVIGFINQFVPEEMREKAVNFVNGFFDGVKEFPSRVGEVAKNVVNTFKNALGNAREWGRDMIDNFVGGIKDMMNKVKSTVSEVADKIKDFLGFSEPKEGPLSNFHTYAPDMIDLFTKGIRENAGQIASTFNDTLKGIGKGAKLEAEIGLNAGKQQSGDWTASAYSDGNEEKPKFEQYITINVESGIVDSVKRGQTLAEQIAMELKQLESDNLARRGAYSFA